MSDLLRFKFVLIFVSFGLALGLLAGCQSSAPPVPTPSSVSNTPTLVQAPPTPTTSLPPTLPPTPPPTATSSPLSPTMPLPTPVPTTASIPTIAPTAPPTPPADTQIGGSPPYLDDRSDGSAVIRSFYNAISRQEYDRAYSYWEAGAASQQLLPYPQFKQGYAATRSVDVTIGPITGQGAAGSTYVSIPVALKTTLTDKSNQLYTGCYVLRLGSPQIQDAPPFRPWAIQQAHLELAPPGKNPVDLLPTACAAAGLPTGVAVPTPTPSLPTDVTADRYLDDRSTPEEVLRSLYNAINRKEYDRAYSYWEVSPTASQPPPYAQFKQGYATTVSVDLTTGTTTSGVAAGNIYFTVPVVLVSHTTDGQTKSYVGCYTLHLGQPAIQDAPPFHPLAIRSAQVQELAAGVSTTTALEQACPVGG